MRSFANIFLKGDLAELLVVTLLGVCFVAVILAVSAGLSAIGVSPLLKASGVGATLLVGMILGMGLGYTYWQRKWRMVVSTNRRSSVTETKRVYLAARFEWKKTMIRVANELKKEGITVTSRWIHGDTEGIDAAMAAKIDLEDLDQADTIICFSSDIGKGAGRHIEFGWAMNSGRRLFIVGEAESVFHADPRVIVCKDTRELLLAIKVGP